MVSHFKLLSSPPHRHPASPRSAPSHRRVARLLALRIPHSLVNTQDKASGLGCCAQSVGLDQSGLPHKGLKVVGDRLGRDVHTEPRAAGCNGYQDARVRIPAAGYHLLSHKPTHVQHDAS